MAFTVSASQKQPCAHGWERSTHEGMGLASQLQTAQAGQGPLWGHVTQAASWGTNQTGTQRGRGHRRGWLFSALTYRHSSRQVTKQQGSTAGPPATGCLTSLNGPSSPADSASGSGFPQAAQRGRWWTVTEEARWAPPRKGDSGCKGGRVAYLPASLCCRGCTMCLVPRPLPGTHGH